MGNILKTIFCNHTSQRCLTSFNNDYIDNIYSNNHRNSKYSVWRCERCGKIIKKRIIEAPSSFNWINITIKNNEDT